MHISSLQLAPALILLSLLHAPATVLYVDVNSTNPVPPYADWTTAATNIQDAVDAATAGDMVLVTNGLYQTGGRLTPDGTSNRVVLDKAVTLQSVTGQAVTVIDGSQAGRCVYLTNGAVLSGFTLTNGASGGNAGGGALCNSTNELLLNCLVTKNTGWTGGGVYSGTLSNCTVTGNSVTTSGGGVANSALLNCTLSGNAAGFSGGGGGAYNATLERCTLSGNSAGWDGGAAYGSTLNNCTLTGNTARYYGGGARASALTNCVVASNRSTDSAGSGGGAAYCTLVNCTIIGNTVPAYGGGTAWCPLVQNCIVYYNIASSGNNDSGSTLSYSCTTPLAAGVGNFADDPQFVNYAGGNLHLAANSLCINTGDNASISTATDLDGNPRLVGSVVDVGAFEYQSVLPVPVAPSVQASYTSVVTGFAVDFTGYIGGRPTASRWEFGDGTIVSNQLPNISHSWATPGTYVVALRAYNADFPDGMIATVTISVTGALNYYVTPTSAHPVSPYTSWATAATNLQPAVDAAPAGGTVLVSNGVYQSGGRIMSGIQSNRVVVAKPVTVRSLNGPGKTFIQGYTQPGSTTGNNNVRCVYLSNGAVLSGFTLTNGGTRGSGDFYQEQCGGGAWCAFTGGVLSNCVLVGNSATNYGGGTYYGTLYNCTLVGNFANYGAGAYNATLNNCSVLSNTAIPIRLGYYGSGGGLYQSKANSCLLLGNAAYTGGGAYNATLTNCTLVGNVATNSGGGSYNSTCRNCLLYYNTAPSATNFSGGSLSYCCATPLPSGTGNFTSAPLFVDFAGGNLRLQSNSPCINAGNNLALGSTVDLDGRPRVVDATVDAGAYEFQGPGLGEFIAWLQQHALPVDGTADFLDPDRDGLNNWQEWVCGTQPSDATSVLKLFSPTGDAAGVTVTWQSVPNRTYYLQRTTDLGAAPAFLSIQSNLLSQTGTTTFKDITATNAGPYFYRVGVQ